MVVLGGGFYSQFGLSAVTSLRFKGWRGLAKQSNDRLDIMVCEMSQRILSIGKKLDVYAL